MNIYHGNNKLFFKFTLIYKSNIQIQISLIIGNLYSTGLIAGISNKKMKVTILICNDNSNGFFFELNLSIIYI